MPTSTRRKHVLCIRTPLPAPSVRLATAILLVSAVGGCADSTVTPLPAIEAVVLDRPPAMLAVGRTRQLVATVHGPQGSVITDVQLDWSSSNASVASVSPAGLATGRRVGSATLTARARGQNGVVSASAAVSVVEGYRVTYLGVSADEGSARALNDLGQVVLGYFERDSQRRAAILWQAGRVTVLEGCFSARSINERGQVLCAVAGPSAQLVPALWENGAIRRLSGFEPLDYLYAGAVNEAGQVAGTYLSSGPPPSARAYVWEDGRVTVLTHPPFKDVRLWSVTDINDRGAVIGGGFNGELYHWPSFVWKDGVWKVFTTGRGSPLPAAINNHGDVVGTYDGRLGGTIEAALWPADGGARLTLTSAGGIASDINDQGQVVGATGTTAFLWQDGGLSYLSDLLVDPAWAIQDDLILSFRIRPLINNSGQIVVTARNSLTGQHGPALLDPIPPG